MLYKDDGVFIAGLTGMSGAGKTTACGIFAESGFSVIDCDTVARRVVERGKPALMEIASRFGSGILAHDGSLDRRKLGNIVFTDSVALNELNFIIYPYITFEIVSVISRFAEERRKLILLDAPTLFESGADKLCDTVVCVTADRKFCAQRIMKRDGLTLEEADNRLMSQHEASFYTERSDFGAVNSGTIAEFELSLRAIAEKVKKAAFGEDKI